MKKLLTLFILIGTLWACNHLQPAENKTKPADPEKNELHEGALSEKLVLNNGRKWKVDASTDNNVKHLQDILKEFGTRNAQPLPAYKKLQEDLERGINKMITECKMTGPDHEALHKWLEPLIAKVGHLKEVQTAAEAASAFKAINNQADIYNQYFEL
jgi:hypothetical protein